MPICDDSTIHVIGEGTKPLVDLRTVEDNEAAANAVLQLVRELTSDPQCAIHFSIAGGRKTLGFYLGYCASLLARPWDEMSHVLVNQPFESTPEFFFPPRPPSILQLRDGPADTNSSKVELASISFIRLRDLMPFPLLQGSASFSQTVRVVDGMVSHPSLSIELTPHARGRGQWAHRIRVTGGLEFVLPPKSLALYWMLAAVAKHADPTQRATDAECDLDTIKSTYLRVYRAVTGVGARYVTDEERILSFGGFRNREFRDALARLIDELKKVLGERGAAVYGPQANGSRNALRYGLNLPPSAIELHDDSNC